MKKLCGLSAFASFMMLLATAGASDLSLVSAGQVLVRAIFCILALLVSLFGVQYFEWKQICARRAKKRVAARKNNQISEAEYRQIA